MSRQSTFSLSKWYMDCVSDGGDLCIGYAAALRWRGLRINYSSMLLRRRNEETSVSTSLQRIAEPAIEGHMLRWSSRPLGVEGTWEALAPPIEQTLLQSPDGSVAWNCLQPKGRAEIRFDHGEPIRGLGYAEHMTMSIPPWRLPIDELRWGRFLSKHDAMVWIEWRGAHPLSLVFRNGALIPRGTVTEQGIATREGETILSLDEGTVLREGYLIRTVLSAIPGLTEILPVASLRTHERKWRSRGRLCDAANGEGWAIHEVVRF